MQSDVPSPPGGGDQTYAEPAGAPCAEAIFATRVAAEIARQLHRSGRQLRFTLAPPPTRVEALLCDDVGFALSRLTPSRVLEIASGVEGDAVVSERARRAHD